jgi:aspartate aminotransferase-like enzyme
MKKSITLTHACDGLVRYKSATGMSPNTIRNYRTTFAKLQAYFDSHPERSCILSGGPQVAVEGAAESTLAPAQVQVRIPRSRPSHAIY